MTTGTFALIFALVALGLIAAYLVMRPNGSRDSNIERRRSMGERRHAMAPVAYERRRGMPDRRLGPPTTLPAA